MHTVELLEEAVRVAERAGYKVRQEWMGGCGCGGCEIKGRKWVFLDLSLGPHELLDVVVDVLRSDTTIASLPMPHQLRELLQLRKTA